MRIKANQIKVLLIIVIFIIGGILAFKYVVKAPTSQDKVLNQKTTYLKEKPQKENLGFLKVSSLGQCPPKGTFLDQKVTICSLNKNYALLVKWLGEKDNLPSGYSVYLKDLSSKKEYHLFDKKGLLDPPGGKENYEVNFLDESFVELSWAIADLGWFSKFFKIINLAKKEVLPLEITAGPSKLIIVKGDKKYNLELDFDTSNFSYEKGGRIVLKDIKLNGKPLGLIKNPISRDFEPYSCELGCPQLFFPQFSFNSKYTKDFSALVFSLDKKESFIFYLDKEKVKAYKAPEF